MTRGLGDCAMRGDMVLAELGTERLSVMIRSPSAGLTYNVLRFKRFWAV
jgi:hypothetical protein